MRVVTFSYSKFAVWHVLAFGMVLVGLILFTASIDTGPDTSTCFFLILLVCLSSYFISKFLVPVIKKQSALSLDEEKIFVRRSNTTVYWRDIAGISWYQFGRTGYLLLERKDGKSDIKVKTDFFSAENDVILKVVQDYFHEVSKAKK
jgi:predicted secreted protein